MEIIHSARAEERVGLIIFDLDGTLADTIESIREGINRTMKHYGYPERSYEQVRTAIGNGARRLVQRSMPSELSSDETLLSEVFEYYNRAYGETYRHCDHCYDGMYESLLRLKEKGYALAILSNKQDAYVKALNEILFPADLFSVAEGQAVGAPVKPDPTVPLSIARRLGFSPEQTAFVGDSEVDVQTGLNSGMLAVGCSWGYRERALLKETGADVILDHPTELCALFL